MYLMNQLRLTDQILNAQDGIDTIDVEQNTYALKLVQKRNGWVDDAQVNAIANLLDVPVTDIEGVATFFNRIYRSPVGRHVILVCDSIACYLTGYEELAAELKSQLGVEFGLKREKKSYSNHCASKRSVISHNCSFCTWFTYLSDKLFR